VKAVVKKRVCRARNIQERKGEQGVVIVLVAVFLLFVVGAMAALAIDAVSLYTARSEAQLAADAAALAGARALANSGMTSNPTDTTLVTNAEALALVIATQVATHNEVGGRTLNPSEVVVSFNNADPTNPRVTVQTMRSDLPTFFARIWGSSALAVKASATAEAYNPLGAGSGQVPVAPTCVKPWLLPNLDPQYTNGTTIFNATTGAITAVSPNPSLLGWTSSPGGVPMSLACGPSAKPRRAPGDCSVTSLPLPTPVAWNYYPGDDATTSFPHPTSSLPTCSLIPKPTPYQESIAGCIQTPIACNSTVNIDISKYATRDTETADAVNCLTHATNNPGDADQVDSATIPSPPFQFLAGTDNPVAVANPTLVGRDVMVSSSLVTVPVFDPNTSGTWLTTGTNVQIIGFVQLFLNPNSIAASGTGVNTTVINLAGCGTSATGTPILGNGASPVAVRLITPP
jgi:Flp pilus assembly protein TadG